MEIGKSYQSGLLFSFSFPFSEWVTKHLPAQHWLYDIKDFLKMELIRVLETYLWQRVKGRLECWGGLEPKDRRGRRLLQEPEQELTKPEPGKWNV
jgi:hypothetical protein